MKDKKNVFFKFGIVPTVDVGSSNTFEIWVTFSPTSNHLNKSNHQNYFAAFLCTYSITSI